MIRRAAPCDIDQVEKCIIELLEYGQEHGAYTSWKRNIYPTRKTAENSLAEGSLYVMEQNGEIYKRLMAICGTVARGSINFGTACWISSRIPFHIKQDRIITFFLFDVFLLF